MRVFKMLKFWCVAFAVAIYHTLRNRNWHMIMIDFEVGEKMIDFEGEPFPRPLRKQLIARRSCNSLDIYWQDFSKLFDGVGDEPK